MLWRTKEGEFTPLGVGLHMNENFLEKVAFGEGPKGGRERGVGWL